MGGQFFSTTYYDWHGLMPLAFPSGQSISILIYFFLFFSLLFKQACLQEIEVRMLVAGWYTPIAITWSELRLWDQWFLFLWIRLARCCRGKCHVTDLMYVNSLMGFQCLWNILSRVWPRTQLCIHSSQGYAGQCRSRRGQNRRSWQKSDLETSERGQEQTVGIRVVEGEIQENKKYQIQREDTGSTVPAQSSILLAPLEKET